jgi:SOS-response transcriptional repressor LexA
MNKFTRRSFAETLILACQLRAPHLVRRNKQLHQGNAALYFGIAQPNFWRWLRTEAEPERTSVERMAAKLELTPAQLRGEAPIIGIDTDEHDDKPWKKLIQRVPLLSSIQAGPWSETAEELEAEAATDWYNITSKVSHRSFALRVEGDSMNNPQGWPSIPEGSIVVIDPEVEPRNGNIVVAKLIDSHRMTLKKLVMDVPFTYLKPLNPSYPIIEFKDNWTIVGVVKQVIQDL